MGREETMNGGSSERDRRLKAALRENLKRRKVQARARDEVAARRGEQSTPEETAIVSPSKAETSEGID
jgi:hypothetical protein